VCYHSKGLSPVAIGTFVLRSVLPGASQSMTRLIAFRVLQGIGVGGDFALTYTVRCRRFASKNPLALPKPLR